MEINWKCMGGSMVVFVLVVIVSQIVISALNFCYFDSSETASPNNNYSCMIDIQSAKGNPGNANLVLMIMLTNLAIPILALVSGAIYYFKEPVIKSMKKIFRNGVSMDVNWKDFGFMYLIAFFSVLLGYAFIFFFSLLQFLKVPSTVILFFNLVSILLMIAIPLGFYYWRNKCNLKDAIIIASLFSFILFLLIFIIDYLLFSIAATFFVGSSTKINNEIELITLIFGFGRFVFFGLISGFITYFAINKILKRKMIHNKS